MVLKIFICPSHIANWSLALLESMGCDRHPIRAMGNFHYQLIFAYVQQVSSPVEMSNSKDHILTQFMHRNLYEISTSKNSPIRGWGGLSKNVQKWPTIDPHINPPIHPTTYTPTHRWGCFSKSQIFKQNWIILISSRFIWFLLIWHDPTHWPTY